MVIDDKGDKNGVTVAIGSIFICDYDGCRITFTRSYRVRRTDKTYCEGHRNLNTPFRGQYRPMKESFWGKDILEDLRENI